MPYIIMTDSSCDLPAGLAKELELAVLPLTLTMDGVDYENNLEGTEISAADFYARLRKGALGTTSAANCEQFIQAMQVHLQQGNDVLYLAFSSGLSSTCANAMMAAEDLQHQYPERKVLAVDTLCASLGQGMLVYLAAMEKRKGKTMEEVADFVRETVPHLCHWFTVSDLHHLKRGGRLSGAATVVGSLLQIKPVMHMDDEGHLTVMAKARGRAASINALLDHMKESAIAPETQTVFISHGDCEEEAKKLASMVQSELHVPKVILNTIGPVIGMHSGPDTLAVFFIGKQR